jgi:hypothetical protein
MSFGYTIDIVTPAWLTEVLRADGALGPTARITSARAEQIAMDTGFASLLYRVELAGDGGPESVVVKLPASEPAVREAMGEVGGYDREVVFYREIAGLAPLRAPHAYHVGQGEAAGDFVLVLEDLRGWENGNHLVGLPIGRARAALERLAQLHAWSASDVVAASVDSFVPTLDDPRYRAIICGLFEAGWPVYQERARRPIPAGVEDLAASFGEHFGTFVAGLTQRLELIHGDIRADNMFFRGDEVAMIDFQLLTRGSGIADAAYVISQGMTTAERDGRDKELLDHYLRAYAAAGGHQFDEQEAWRHYRLAVLMFFAFPVTAMHTWDQLPDTAQELCLELTERAIATIEDIDAVAVLR